MTLDYGCSSKRLIILGLRANIRQQTGYAAGEGVSELGGKIWHVFIVQRERVIVGNCERAFAPMMGRGIERFLGDKLLGFVWFANLPEARSIVRKSDCSVSDLVIVRSLRAQG